jgi:hypothetical protein
MSWENGWQQIEAPKKTGNVDELIARANEQITRANNKEKLMELIDAYEAVLEIDPANYEVLWNLGRYCNLMGYAYSDNKKEKGVYFMKAVKFCEQAMYTNPEFKSLVDKGGTVWTACEALSKNEMEAMWYWYTGVGTYWKECLGGFGQLLNLHWAKRLDKVTKKMVETNPRWGGGLPYFGRAMYYINLPGFLGGGDMKKTEDLFNNAFEAGPNWLYTRWGRAKFFYTKNKDKEGFKKDLEWVIAQDPLSADSPYPWNIYYQRDARSMLTHMEDYF